VARFQILYWQDVPSLVRAFADDGTTLSQQLPDWFQQEIDRRAMEQGLIGSDAYLEQWRWGEMKEEPGSPGEVVEAVLASYARLTAG
jgi:hypothetical protein